MIRYRVQSFHVEAEVLRAFAGHVQIVDALKKKDASALQEAVRRHVEEAREIIRRCSFAAEGESVSA
jgi:DNA-binding GntR family transcriptional regulator